MRFLRPASLRRCFASLVLAAASLAPAQIFLQPKVIPTGNWPAAVYTADVNGDGIPDLIYIDQGATAAASTTHVLLGDGTGNFRQSATVATQGSSVAIGDLTGTGYAGIAYMVAAHPGNVFPYEYQVWYAAGTGTGTFASPQLLDAIGVAPFPATPQFGNLTIAKLHASGPNDLLAEDTANNLLFDTQLQSPPATFFSYSPLPAGPGPIAVADLNRDGYNDVIVDGQTTYAAQIFLGVATHGGINQNSTPTLFTGLAGGTAPYAIHSMLVQDYFGTGTPALIAETANGHIDIFNGDGSGSFNGGYSNASGVTDGREGNGGHLIFANNLSSLNNIITATPAGISGSIAQHISLSQPQPIYNAGPGHTSYAVADFNGDGYKDIAVDSPEGIALLFGAANGTFQTSLAYAAGQPALSSALGAFTSYPFLDAVVSTAATQAQLLVGNGDGTFEFLGYGTNSPTPVTTTTQTGPAGLWSTVQTGDFNGDGLLDILLTADGPAAALPRTGASSSGAVTQSGTGNGGFSTPATFTFAGLAACPGAPEQLYGTSQVADYNGDAISDFANRDSHMLRVLLGTKGATQPTFGNGIPDADCNPHAHDLIASGDLNGDGLIDLVEQTDGHLEVQLNDGAGFQALGDLSVAGSLTTPGQLTAPALSSTFNGPAIPVASGGLGFAAFIGSMTVADLDKDGNQDLIVAYANLSANLQAPSSAAPNYIYIWYGSGGGKFLTSAKHPVNPVVLTPSRNFYQTAVVDLNLDGLPDLVLSDGYLLSVQLGKVDGTLGAETHYLAGAGINSISVADVNTDNAPDLVLANGGAVLSNPVANLETLATNPDVNTGGITVLLNHAASPTAAFAVTASPEPSTYGSPFTLTVTSTVSMGGTVPTGSCSFMVDGYILGYANLVNGLATFPVPSALYATLAIGSHSIGALFEGDHYYPSQYTYGPAHNVVAGPKLAAVTGAVAAVPEPSTYGSAFSLTATITPTVSNTTTPPTGTFSFAIDGSTIGSANVTSLSAAIAVPAFIYDTLAVGSHTLTAVYSGDANYATATFTGTHTVALIPTSLNLLLCVDPPGSNFPCANPITATPLISPITMYFGQSLDGVAIESAVNLTGSIIFHSGSSTFCTLNANLSQGTNTCPPTSGYFPAGTTNVYATYTGDSTHSASTSNSIVVTVLADTTTATVTSSLNPATYGQSVTFTADVQGNYSPGIGQAIFLDGTSVLGTVTLDATGQAQFTTSLLAVGTHPIHVAFPGSANFNTASSPVLNQVINSPLQPVPSAVALISSPNPSAPGQPVTFTATVTVPGAFAVIPTGTVTFLDGTTPLGTATLNAAGVAVFVTSALASGSHNITAAYSGAAASGGVGPVLPPLPPRPPAAFAVASRGVFGVSGPVKAAKIARPQILPSSATLVAPAPAIVPPQPHASSATPAILPSTSPVLVQVVTYPIGAEPTGFDLTVSPVPVTIGVGRTAVLLVTIRDASGFNQPVALTCSNLPTEASCTFIQSTIPAGGGSTSLYLATAAPHACGTTTPYFVGSLNLSGAAGTLLALLVLLPGLRRRKLPRALLLLLLSFAGLAAISGCGNCTDLGTRPGTYSFTVTGTAQGGTTKSQVVQLTTTIP